MNKIWTFLPFLVGAEKAKLLYRINESLVSLLVWLMAYVIVNHYAYPLHGSLFILGAIISVSAKWVFSGRVWDKYTTSQPTNHLTDIIGGFIGGKK